MPKTCVKNVDSFWIITGKTSAYTSTKIVSLPKTIIQLCKNLWFINLFIQFLYIGYSTYIRPLFNLLNKTFTHNPQYLLLRPLNNN